jgi:hypothetical protein
MQITAEHSEAVSQRTWISMEEWLFLYRVALDRAYIAPGYIKGSTAVVTNFADSGLAIWDLATMSAGKTSHPVAVELFVQFALANIFINDFAQRVHTYQV